MADRTRVIWEGRCPTCGENGFVPNHNRAISITRWCDKCQHPVDCVKVSYTGPELEPMVPNVHHVWCNGQRGPVVGCRWCCHQDKEGHWVGMWIDYPYDPATGPDENFTERHFPNVKVRR